MNKFMRDFDPMSIDRPIIQKMLKAATTCIITPMREECLMRHPYQYWLFEEERVKAQMEGKKLAKTGSLKPGCYVLRNPDEAGEDYRDGITCVYLAEPTEKTWAQWVDENHDFGSLARSEHLAVYVSFPFNDTTYAHYPWRGVIGKTLKNGQIKMSTLMMEPMSMEKMQDVNRQANMTLGFLEMIYTTVGLGRLAPDGEIVDKPEGDAA